jgi:hypothetical protein
MSLVLQSSGGGQITIQEPATASNFTATLPASTGTILTTTSPKAGNVIQVVQTVKSDTFSTSSTSYTDVTGLSVSITPTSSSSKILVLVNMTCGMGADYVFFTRITRAGTAIDIGDAAGSRTRATTGGYQGGTGITFQTIPQNIMFLDSPATTSSTTYSVQVATENSGGIVYLNRTANDGDNSSRGRFSSTITVMEIAA